MQSDPQSAVDRIKKHVAKPEELREAARERQSLLGSLDPAKFEKSRMHEVVRILQSIICRKLGNRNLNAEVQKIVKNLKMVKERPQSFVCTLRYVNRGNNTASQLASLKRIPTPQGNDC
ncbi:hypothetical protein, unlikely [Trypanosoma congolense IL3000]|uniref:Uncharacterized protein n=1 Tax=Trypanosoma congolense (strain IL3000) TaxID=1068625 RepID=F9W922_TRYCI|nr:hypothetical protein, unlikely [Trypanosoma congolense IL3000]